MASVSTGKLCGWRHSVAMDSAGSLTMPRRKDRCQLIGHSCQTKMARVLLLCLLSVAAAVQVIVPPYADEVGALSMLAVALPQFTILSLMSPNRSAFTSKCLRATSSRDRSRSSLEVSLTLIPLLLAPMASRTTRWYGKSRGTFQLLRPRRACTACALAIA